MSVIFLILSFFGLLCTSIAVSINKCKAEDSACIQQSAQLLVPTLAAGIPEFGIKSLDPLHIPKIDASHNDLKLIAKGVVVKGMNGCTIPAVSRDPAKHKLNVDVLCTVDVQAEYEIKGKILLLPIDGTGHLSVQLYQILISVQAHLKDVERNANTYWNIDKWDFNWHIKEKAKIELVDLFAGSPELTQSMREMMGQSSTEIVKEVGGPIVNAITTEVVEAIRLLFNHVPAQDLAIN